MLRFRIFGIPVVVEPWFWVAGFLLGGGTRIQDRDSLLKVLLWMGICFVSILAHELGHALSGRHLAGGRQRIRLWAMGGLAYNDGGRFTTRSRLLMILAGPGAGLLIFVLTAVGILIAFRGQGGIDLLHHFVWGKRVLHADAYNFVMDGGFAAYILNQTIWINLWWSLVNLLPVFPLDGGQAATELMSSRKKVHQIGLYTAVGFAVVGLILLKSIFIALLFGFLAWQNYEQLKRHNF